MKKQIKIKFVDFYENFVPEESLFYKVLSERYSVVLSDEPDYIICSVFGQNHLKYDCVKIFYTGENQSADFNLYDYAIGFDYMEFGDRYYRFPFFYFDTESFDALENRKPLVDLSGKTDFCSFVVSNNNASPERDLFFDELTKYKKVSSGGRYRNNVGGPVTDKLEFQQRHKFAIAFENCSQPGYTTEKILQAYAAQAVPIYWGDPLVCLTFNEESFINCSSYSSWDDVVRRIKELDNDDDAYMKMVNARIFAESVPTKEEMVDGLKNFLFNIFDQEIDNAVRYNRYYWGRRYVKLARTREKAYNMSPRGIAESIYKKTLWKWRRKNKFFWKLDRLFK